EKFEFFGAPSPGGRSVRKITSREETERLPENRLGRSQRLRLSQERKPAGDVARQIDLRHARPGAGRALVGNGETGRVQSQRIPPRHGHRLPAGGSWTTRVQARRVSAKDPTADRKPKACQ